MQEMCMTLQLILTLLSQCSFACHAFDMLPCHKRVPKLGCALQVVGEQEMKEQTVNVRTRDMETHGMHSLKDLTAKLLEEHSSRSLVSAFKKSSGLHAHVGQPANQEPVAAAAVSAEAEQSDNHQLDKARVN